MRTIRHAMFTAGKAVSCQLTASLAAGLQRPDSVVPSSLLCALCASAVNLVSTPAFAQEPSAGETMEQLSDFAERQLAASVAELDQVREQIAAEKLPLARELKRLPGMQDVPAYLDGVRALLTSQNTQGSFGDYESKRTTYRVMNNPFDIDVGAYLHNTETAVWALLEARDHFAPARPANRGHR